MFDVEIWNFRADPQLDLHYFENQGKGVLRAKDVILDTQWGTF
jgi:hypothetical protein